MELACIDIFLSGLAVKRNRDEGLVVERKSGAQGRVC